MANSSQALAVAVIAVLLSTLGIVFVSSNRPGLSEAASSCSSTQVAQTESNVGALSCVNRPVTASNKPLHAACSIATVSQVMAGFKFSYTTSGTGMGGIFITVNFQMTEPSVAAPPVNSLYQIAYGTGTAPNCNASLPGGSGLCQFQAKVSQSDTSITTVESPSISCTLASGTLTASTAYWFDLVVSDSTVDTWIYGGPGVLNVLEP